MWLNRHEVSDEGAMSVITRDATELPLDNINTTRPPAYEHRPNDPHPDHPISLQKPPPSEPLPAKRPRNGHGRRPPFPSTAAPDALIDHERSISYWESMSADTNGMLGGYPQISRVDLQGSANFLTKLRRNKSQPTKQPLPPLNRVADCGAGVGRITKGLLLNVSRTVDVVEPVTKFTDALLRSLGNGEWAGAGAGAGEASGKEERGQVGRIFSLGLQDWIPEVGAYDVIWHQWCLGHLTDTQLVEYLKRCKEGLVKEGPAWIVVKENLSTHIEKRDNFDEEDSSVTRADVKFRKLFKEAGLRVVASELQRGFPKGLYPVSMYALKPE